MGEKPPKEAPDFTSGHRIRMRENYARMAVSPFRDGNCWRCCYISIFGAEM